MNLLIKYDIKNVPAIAQYTDDANYSTGITGENFIGTIVTNYTLALGNQTAANNSHKGSILPSTNSISTGSFVDKVVGITLPVLDATTTNTHVTPLLNLGINGIIVGVEILGIVRTEAANVAAYGYNSGLDTIVRSVSKGRLVLNIPAALNAIGESELILRITYSK